MQDARQIPRSQKAAGGAIMGFLGLVELRHTKVFLCYDIHGTALSPALVPYTGRLRAVPRLKQTHRSGGSPKEKLMNTTTSCPPHRKETRQCGWPARWLYPGVSDAGRETETVITEGVRRRHYGVAGWF
jgi:hypothetical protein